MVCDALIPHPPGAQGPAASAEWQRASGEWVCWHLPATPGPDRRLVPGASLSTCVALTASCMTSRRTCTWGWGSLSPFSVSQSCTCAGLQFSKHPRSPHLPAARVREPGHILTLRPPWWSPLLGAWPGASEPPAATCGHLCCALGEGCAP